MKPIQPTLLWILAFIFGVTSGGKSAAARGFEIYDQLIASSERNGYPSIAEAGRFVKSYRQGLDRCPTGTESNRQLGVFLDNFARQMDYYMNNSSIRPAFRREVESYVANSAALVRVYIKEKQRRFYSDPNTLPDADKKMIKTATWFHQETARILRVSGQSVASLEVNYLANPDSISTNIPWNHIKGAVSGVKSEDRVTCDLKTE